MEVRLFPCCSVSCTVSVHEHVRVSGLMGPGAYAEYIAVSTKMLVHKPAQLSWEEAAGVPEVMIFSALLQMTNHEPHAHIPALDMDHRIAGAISHRRISIRTIRPLARGSLLGLHLRHPTSQSSWRQSHLRNSWVSREDRLPGKRARHHRRLQLQDPRLGD